MNNEVLPSDLLGHRTLATVVFTDCVGFSARMSVDEAHTLDLIRRDLKLMKQVCEQFEGRVLKSTGDGLLMCFVSAVKAVECAIEIQASIAANASALPPEDTLQHRIGIHLADIFISETDVMGNGVNIAARLQTEATPGGICISQTVYEVVRASLTRETQYLGPRELKNIREVVPIYKVLLEPEQTAIDHLGQAVRQLEKSRNLLRLKKLLLYTCRRVWESQTDRLQALSLRELLQELLTLAPTLEQLKRLLDASIQTLSKQTEYSFIAHIITSEVAKLYPSRVEQAPTSDPALASGSAGEQAGSSNLQSLYEQAAHDLEQNQNTERIKKLILYVCRNNWESNAAHLKTIRLPELLAELHTLAPTLEALRSLLDRFVQTLSKRAEYSIVANAIIARMIHLYTYADESSSASEDDPTFLTVVNVPIRQEPSPANVVKDEATIYNDVVRELGRETNSLRIKKLILYVCWQQWENDPVRLEGISLGILVRELHKLAPTIDQLQVAFNTAVAALNKPAEYHAIAQVIIDKLSKLYPASLSATGPEAIPAPEKLTAVPTIPTAELEAMPVAIADAISEVAQPTSAVTENASLFQSISLFDYRLELMKYVNPLRVKILFFSALHDDFNFSTQDWLSLRTHDLDSLIRRLLNTCRTHAELETMLYGVAKRLKDPDENEPTVRTVLKCLRPLYGKAVDGEKVESLIHGSRQTRLRSKPEDETAINFSPDDEDDYTCQLLPSPPDLNRTFERSLPPHPDFQSETTELLLVEDKEELDDTEDLNHESPTHPPSNQGTKS